MADVLDEEVEAVYGEAMDVILEAETRALKILGGLTDDQLISVATSCEAVGGTFGNFMGHLARMTRAMRNAADYMKAHGSEMATWDQVHAWAAKKGAA